MSLLNEFIRSSGKFNEENGIFYQNGLVHPSPFEDEYLRLRQQEGRVYTDEVLSGLPVVSPYHAHAKEWALRGQSAQKLIAWLKEKSFSRLLEVGCGNGWLLHRLHQQLKLDCCGMDINEAELVQASRVWKHSGSLSFLFADIHTLHLEDLSFDAIILASSIQYFQDLPLLFKKLFALLKPKGEIHILDSPFYSSQSLDQARVRTQDYFHHAGHPAMTRHYHHHTWDQLKPFHHRVLYNPDNMANRAIRKFCSRSPFPWILVQP